MTTTQTRSENRAVNQLRTLKLEVGYTQHAEGSVLISCGNTKVICTASLADKVPGFLKGQNQGWLTAEYGMLPRATHTRMDREAAKGKQSGRTQEIQRLIGRSLRAAFDLNKMGERTLHIDCDVIQADGGTRTASITGGFVAAYLALQTLVKVGKLDAVPLINFVAAISVGIVGGVPLLDLDYVEDSGCETDMNVVMSGAEGLIEVQGTAEGTAFSRAELNALLDLAQAGIATLMAAQKSALGLT